MNLREMKEGGFHYVPGLGARYHERQIMPGLLGSAVLGMIMSADGKVVTWAEFSAFSDSGDIKQLVKVIVCHLRARLRDMGAPADVIETVRKQGLRWNRAAFEQKEAA